MSKPPSIRRQNVRDWLRAEGYEPVAINIELLEEKWAAESKTTRRNWWAVLAGRPDGRPRVVDGVTFPVIPAVRTRQGLDPTDSEKVRAMGSPVPSHPLTAAVIKKLTGPAAPFLFIGSGVSRRFLNLPDWGSLLKRFCAMTGREYNYYLSAADGDLSRLASLLVPDFHEYWWKSSDFAASRAAAQHLMQSKADPLKYEISEFLRKTEITSPADAEMLQEFESLGRAVVDGVITTNWDLLLEDRFPGFTPYVGQEQLLFAPSFGVGEIYKIHGSCTDFRSLVLTAEDYAQYSEKNAYLAAKLLTVFIEHPIVFLGYSLTDANMKAILDSIAACLSAPRLQEFADRLVFVQWNPKAIEGEVGHHTIQTGGKNLITTRIETASLLPVLQAMESIRRKYPAPILRRLKEDIYELVKNNDPAGRLFVDDIENAHEKSAVEVVFGVGVIDRLADVGISSFNADHLINGLVFNNLRLPPDKVVSSLLPNLIDKSPKIHAPVYVFLRHAGLLDEKGVPTAAGVPEPVRELATNARKKTLPSKSYHAHKSEVQSLSSVSAVIKQYGPINAAFYLPFLDDASIDRDELRAYLQTGSGAQLKVSHDLHRTQYRKLALLLDWLLYGPAKPFSGPKLS